MIQVLHCMLSWLFLCENLEVWVSRNYSSKRGNLLTNHYRERNGKNTKYSQNQGVLCRAVGNNA